MKNTRKIIELFLDDTPSVIQDYNFTEDDFSKCEIEFVFYESSTTRTPYIIEESIMSVVYQNPNGDWGNDKLEVIDNNRALVTLSGWAIDTNGTVKAMVQGYDTEGRLTFGDFKFKVKKDFGPLQLEETDKFSLLTKLVNDINKIINNDLEVILNEEKLRAKNEEIRLANEEERLSNEEIRLANEEERKGAIEGINEDYNSLKKVIVDETQETITDLQSDYSELRKVIIDENQAANLQDQIKEVNSQLDHKANNDIVVKKGYGTLSDFDEDTRRAIQGMDSGQINAVLGDGNVMLKNLNDEIVDTIKGNNLITGTQLLTFTDDGGVERTYACTNFIESGTTVQTYSRNWVYDFVLEFDLDGNYIRNWSNATLPKLDINPNIKFCFSKKNTTTVYDRDTHILILGTGEHVEDKICIRKDIIPLLDGDNIKDDSLSIDKLDSTFTTVEKGNNLYKHSEKLDSFIIKDKDNNTVDRGNYTNWLPVEPNATYCSSLYSTQFYFFTKDKEYISNTTLITYPAIFTTHNNCEFVLIKLYSEKPNTVVLKGTSLDGATQDKIVINPNLLPSSTTGYSSRWKGKEWLLVGDSISTEGSVYAKKGYGQLVAKDLGITLNNISVSGRTMYEAITWIEQQNKSYDLITIMMGANDQGYGVGLGNMEDVAKRDGSFYARCKFMCELLISKYGDSNTVYAFFTTIRRSQGSNIVNDDYKNVLGLTTGDYANAIKEVANYYGIECLDLYENNVDSRYKIIRDNYFIDSSGDGSHDDGTHLNDEGHAKFIAPKVRDFLEKIAPYSVE